MSDDDFNLQKESLKGRRLEIPKKMSEQGSRWWFEIITRQYRFDRAVEEIGYLESITKNQLLRFYQVKIVSRPL